MEDTPQETDVCFERSDLRSPGPAIVARPRRRGDRIAKLSAAVRKSAFGTKRTFKEVRCDVRYWEQSGHSEGVRI